MIPSINPVPEEIRPVLQSITRYGGRPLIVGGAVRDALRGIAPHDADIEVHNLPIDFLADIIRRLGEVREVGKSFGVLKLTLPSGTIVDISVPRRENTIGAGHRDFETVLEPMSTFEAAGRRDFTMNALAYDPAAGQIIDHFNGVAHLHAGVLVHTSSAFREDPLRVLRGMRFCARFELEAAEETLALCRDMLPEAHSLPGERIWTEWEGWAASAAPSYGLQFLLSSHWIRLYPDLIQLGLTEQDERYHPEGTVWEHTMQVCDQATLRAVGAGQYSGDLERRERVILVLAALCHDLGKPATTVRRNGHLKSPGHAAVGVVCAQRFLGQIHAPQAIIDRVLPLVQEHLAHAHVTPNRRVVRRLAERLSPATIDLWARLVDADIAGRAPLPPHAVSRSWLALADTLGVQNRAPEPVLLGRHLLALGMDPGPRIGHFLRLAWEAQMDGEFATVEDGQRWVLEHEDD